MNPGKFWSDYKAITKTTRIPGVIKHESVQATRPIDQANLFNVFFHSVFAPPDSRSTAVCLPRLDGIASNVNYLNYALALATFLNSFNRFMSTKRLSVFPLSYCKLVLTKFHLRYVDYSICP